MHHINRHFSYLLALCSTHFDCACKGLGKAYIYGLSWYVYCSLFLMLGTPHRKLILRSRNFSQVFANSSVDCKIAKLGSYHKISAK